MFEDPHTRRTDAAPAAAPPGCRPPAGQRLADGLWMDRETVQDGDRVRVRVSGEIDLDAAGPFDAALAEALHASGTGLDVDLSGVSFCNSTGLNTLLRLRLTAHRTGRDVVVTGLSDRVRRLLVLTDTLGLLTSAPSPADRAGHPGGDGGPR